MIWITLLGLIGIIVYKFLNELNKDKNELEEGLDNKFRVIIDELNNFAFDDLGEVKYLDRRTINLYKSPANQIIFFDYITGSLTITWRYKMDIIGNLDNEDEF